MPLWLIYGKFSQELILSSTTFVFKLDNIILRQIIEISSGCTLWAALRKDKRFETKLAPAGGYSDLALR